MVISSFLLLDVRKTILNHPYFDGLYHPFVVKLGMDPIALPTSFFVEEITAKCSSHFTVPGLPMDLRRSPWLESHRDRDVRRWLSNIKYIYNMYICIIHNIYICIIMYHYYTYIPLYIYIYTPFPTLRYFPRKKPFMTIVTLRTSLNIFRLKELKPNHQEFWSLVGWPWH